MTKPTLADLMARTVRVGECLVWTGHTDKCGYARKGGLLVSRLVFSLAKGDPTGFLVCHTCDNPTCINPLHLFPGNAKLNGIDSSLKGRANNQHGGQSQTHCINGHEFTPENTYWRPGKIASRDCRICQRARVAAYTRRKAMA